MSGLQQRYGQIAMQPEFEGRCFVCHRPYKKKRGFTFHHKRYQKVVYSDYPNRNAYLTALFDEIADRPEDFALLCRRHHHVIEQLKRYSQEKFDNLMLLTLESRR